jgi:hypothetical protein
MEEEDADSISLASVSDLPEQKGGDDLADAEEDSAAETDEE